MKRVLSFILALAVAGLSCMQVSPGAHAQRTAQSQQPYYDIAQIVQGAPLNFYNPKGMGGQWGGDMTIAFLADWKFGVNPFSPKSFFPVLAKSWSLSKDGKSLTVVLNSKAKWSDGKPVTAHDIAVSVEIGYAESAVQPWGLSDVKEVNSHEVIFHQLKDNSYNLFMFSVLTGLVVAPASQYEALLPSNIGTSIKNSQYTGNDPALQKAAQDAQSQLNAVKTKVEAYQPTTNLSDGPYQIQNVSPEEISLVKNPDYVDAGSVKVNSVILVNYSDNQSIWNLLIGGKVYQATSGGMTTDIVNQIKQGAGGHNVEYTVPSTASLQLVFNESVYPYNLVKVRQAIAYLINRQELQEIAEPVGGSVSKYITGTVDSNAKAYLTPAQLKGLNPYNFSKAKATALLKSAGFKLQGGKWMLPNGQPWSMTLYTVSGFNDVIEAFQTIKSTLDRFGIPTEVQLVPTYGQYLVDIKAQKYSVMFWIGTGATPYGMMGRLYMAPNGYNVENGQLTRVPPSNHVQGNWLDFPSAVTVKGVGKVQAGPLTYSLSQTRNAKKIKQTVAKLMIMTNQYVPEITMWNVTQVGFVNDQYFTDYPTKNRLVMQTCFGYYPPIGCWETRGYVHAK